MLAVALLYAPLAAAVWTAQSMPCCTGDHCPIAAHHHQNTSPPPAHQMDCAHEMSGFMSCTMSCCETTDRPTVASLSFLLPHATLAAGEPSVTPVSEVLQTVELPRSIEPLSPPPRSLNAAL